MVQIQIQIKNGYTNTCDWSADGSVQYQGNIHMVKRRTDWSGRSYCQVHMGKSWTSEQDHICNGSHIFLHSLSCIFFVLMTLVFLSSIFEIHWISALLHVHKALELILDICFWVFHDGLVVFLLREVMKGNEIQLTTKTSRAVNLALFGQAASRLEAYLSKFRKRS